MKYIGVPACPYCKKRINLIRVWSVKKHGEFMCPRCKGISNIFLSPLTYVFAILAIGAGFLIYFFNKFVFDSLNIITGVYVFIPFVVFFIVSLFFVYLEKPIIKKVRKTADGRYFDQNGNELKMKMGKLVAASSQVSVPDVPRADTVRNTRDMTGSIPQVKNRQDDSMFESVDDKAEEFGDNEALYAKSAAKLGRQFTTQVDPNQLKSITSEMKIAGERPVRILADEAPAKRDPRPAQRLRETINREYKPPQNPINPQNPLQTPASAGARPAARPDAVQRPAARPTEPVRERPAVRPDTVQRPAARPTESVRERPAARPDTVQRPAARPTEPVRERPAVSREDELPVGTIARERNQNKATQSGFEDLIAEYDKLANGDTSEIPIRRKNP